MKQIAETIPNQAEGKISSSQVKNFQEKILQRVRNVRKLFIKK